jgi:hypothetical protein
MNTLWNLYKFLVNRWFNKWKNEVASWIKFNWHSRETVSVIFMKYETKQDSQKFINLKCYQISPYSYFDYLWWLNIRIVFPKN